MPWEPTSFVERGEEYLPRCVKSNRLHAPRWITTMFIGTMLRDGFNETVIPGGGRALLIVIPHRCVGSSSLDRAVKTEIRPSRPLFMAFRGLRAGQKHQSKTFSDRRNEQTDNERPPPPADRPGTHQNHE